VLVFRLCRVAFQALDGEGARLYGGRWNSPGRPAVYTSSSRALAALEYLVHVDPVNVPSDLVLLTIDVPDTAPRDAIDPAALPARWAADAEPPECQALGDAWLRAGATLALEVPAAPVPEERNVILDPRHPAHAGVRIVSSRPFVFDPRLLG
jgi:RES domain-containing protein